jgi:16S rRNA processing protein RimM
MSRSQPDPSWRPSRVVVGAVGRAHGLDGFAHLVGHGGTVPLEPGTPVQVGERDAVVTGRKGTAERPLVRFDIAATREAVDELRGADVSIAAGALPDTGDDEFFHVDLLGCAVVCEERTVGVVRRIHEYPANDVLELDTGEMVPFVADVVVAVDVPGRTVQLAAGFLAES